MTKVIINMSMSLDGFSAGANIRPEEPMGDGGEQLHEWMFAASDSKATYDHTVEFFEKTGAYIMGKLTTDLGIKPWGDNPPFHAPCFVLSKEPRKTITKEGGTSYSFVTDGIESALRQAKAAAGDKNVTIMGGANIAQQYLNAGLVDEIHLHLVHLLLGSGTRLFDKLTIQPTSLKRTALVDDPGVTHLIFQLR